MPVSPRRRPSNHPAPKESQPARRPLIQATMTPRPRRQARFRGDDDMAHIRCGANEVRTAPHKTTSAPARTPAEDSPWRYVRVPSGSCHQRPVTGTRARFSGVPVHIRAAQECRLFGGFRRQPGIEDPERLNRGLREIAGKRAVLGPVPDRLGRHPNMRHSDSHRLPAVRTARGELLHLPSKALRLGFHRRAGGMRKTPSPAFAGKLAPTRPVQ